MSRPLTVAWFLPVRHRHWDRMPASCWIRCLQLLPYLERLGVRSVVNDPRRPADVAVFVRRQDAASRGLALAARARGTRVVVDLCVNYLDDTGMAPGGYGVTARHVAECRAMLEVADAVTTASAFIAGRARECHPRVEYLPDSVDRRHFRHTRAVAPREPLTAIWCGYSVKAVELEPILARLDKRGIGLVLVSDARPALSIPFTFVRWRHARAPDDLLRGDFAIAPRDLDFAYNRGHSFFRIGVFLAQGVPVLAGPVPSYAEVLTPEVNGLVCTTEADWDAALDRVVAEPGRLSAWSRAAVAAMEPHWTERVSERYAAFLDALAAAPARPWRSRPADRGGERRPDDRCAPLGDGTDPDRVPAGGLLVFFTYRVSLATWAERGILEREIQTYRPLLARLGVTFVTYGAGDGAFEPRLGGIHVLPRPARLRPAALSLLAPWIYRRQIRAAAVLKTNQASGAWTGVLAKWLYRRPLVVRCGYPWSFNSDREGRSLLRRVAVRRLERLAVRAADRVVVTSAAAADYLVSRHGVDRARVRILPNAIDLGCFRPVPAPQREKGLIAFVGRLAPEKRLDVLVAAAALVPGARLLLVGEGSERQRLAQAAAAAGVPLELPGTVPNAALPGWLARAEVFALPSAYEGQPKALLEAMACGLPVVASDIPGVREVVQHGETGWLAPAGDVRAFAAALGGLAADPGLRDRLGGAARAAVERRHSLEAVVEQELAVLAEVARIG